MASLTKAAVHVWLDTIYYRWVDWCVHHSSTTSSSSKAATLFCRFYDCRVSRLFCKEQCRHRRGY